jgi:hypothetical protein
MEFVPGTTVADRLTSGSLPADEGLLVGRQIAEALEAAHDKGVIHRDLKPGNIKLTPEGKVKLLDFGLAKVIAVAPSPGDDTTTQEATRDGIILGTPYYMSPEQVRGQPLDRRTDIWSFGCVLFELLTGQRSFPGETGADIFAAILEREPNWSLLPSEIPPAILSLMQRCLRKDLSRRLRDIGDARIELLDATDFAQTPRAVVVDVATPVHATAAGGPVSRPASGLKRPPPWMALAANAKRERVEHVQRGIFFTRLKDLRTLYRRTPLVWAAGAMCGLTVGLALGLVSGPLWFAPWLGNTWASVLGVLVGVGAAISVALWIGGWWQGRLEHRLRLLHTLHAREIEQWGGEPMLSDHLAIEGLLEVMERESN